MATGKIMLDEGSTLNTATNTISEDAVTKHIPRSVINTSAGVEISPLTDTQLRATPVPVSGTLTATGPLTDTQLRATAVPVSGTVTASGPLTDTQLRATAVPVSGPLTDTQLRATAVPVSGTVTASGPLTDTELRATAVPVTGTITAVTAITNALPSGTNLLGKVGIDQTTDGTTNKVSLGSDTVTVDLGTNNDVTVSSGKTILRAAISGASSGNNTIVGAVADKKIKVLSVCLVATAAVTVRFESGADGTALTGVMSLDAKSGFVINAPADPNMHWFETGVNTLLNMELGGAVQVSGFMTYYTEA